MSVRKFSFRGLMAPVFTPFNSEEELQPSVIPDYAKYLLDQNIEGILVNGTTGEGTSMTTKERSTVLSLWLDQREFYNPTIMVQVGGTNINDVISLAQEAEENNVSAILCLPDLFFRPSNVNELIHYLKIVSSAAPLTPLLYYHIPSFTGINLNMKELLERSVEVKTFVGIKFTDNNLAMGFECVKDDLKSHFVFLGCDSLFLTGLLHGFDSAIGTTINIFPTLNKNILAYYNEGNYKMAELTQRKLNHSISQITKYGSWVSSMKAAMRKLTNIDVGPVREPLIDVNLECVNL